MDETTKHLIELILSWWEEEQYRTVCDSGEHEVYGFGDKPEFVKEALKMMDGGEL